MLVVLRMIIQKLCGNIRVSVMPQGTTHKNEWATFNRQTQNRKVFPVQLSNMLVKNKQDLFQTWMECGKSWDKVAMKVDRSVTQKNRSLSGWIAKQVKTLKEDYNDPDKLQKLLKNRIDSGLFYNDADFPDDENDPFLQRPTTFQSWRGM